MALDHPGEYSWDQRTMTVLSATVLEGR